jgi:hypothetical protein
LRPSLWMDGLCRRDRSDEQECEHRDMIIR